MFCVLTTVNLLLLHLVHTMEYYLAIKNYETLSFVTAWMDLESIILSEINQMEKDKSHMILSTCGI